MNFCNWICNDLSLTYRNLREDWREAIADNRGRTALVRNILLPGFHHQLPSLMIRIVDIYHQSTIRFYFHANLRTTERPNFFTEAPRTTELHLPSIFSYLPGATRRRLIIHLNDGNLQNNGDYAEETQNRNEAHLRNAAAAVRLHDEALPQDAGAKDLLMRGVRNYVEILKQPAQILAQEIEQLSALPDTQETSAILEDKRKAHRAAVAELQDQLENLEACMPDSYLQILHYVVLQAIQSQSPLMRQGEPTSELPLALHAFGQELETLRQRQNNLTKEDHKIIQNLASTLQQDHLHLRVGITTALTTYLESEEFKRLLQN